jgi:hypothetical protein
VATERNDVSHKGDNDYPSVHEVEVTVENGDVRVEVWKVFDVLVDK